MSVLIKGMKMPTGNYEIIVRIQSDGRVLEQWGHRFNQEFIAVPVPPHGRLIDADAVEKQIDYSQKPTHGDLMRASTDEELAEMHVGVGCPPGTDLNELCFDENEEELLCTPPRCRECWLNWLRQEAHHEP